MHRPRTLATPSVASALRTELGIHELALRSQAFARLLHAALVLFHWVNASKGMLSN